ncbi:MAG: hypothetical protein QXH27_02550 [Candidatus Micrarchaeia archaeon]
MKAYIFGVELKGERWLDPAEAKAAAVQIFINAFPGTGFQTAKGETFLKAKTGECELEFSHLANSNGFLVQLKSPSHAANEAVKVKLLEAAKGLGDMLRKAREAFKPTEPAGREAPRPQAKNIK